MKRTRMHVTPLTSFFTCLLLVTSGCVYAQGNPAQTNKGAQNGQPFQALQDQIDEANATLDELAELSPTLEELQADVESLQITIEALGAQVDNLSSTSEDNTETIEGLLADIAALDGELTSKQDILDGACDEGSTLRAIYPDGGFLCEVGGGSASSISTTILTSSYLTLPRKTAPRVLEASCPAGFQVSGGGYESYNLNARARFDVLNSMPVDASTWHLTLSNQESGNGTERVRIRMVCVR